MLDLATALELDGDRPRLSTDFVLSEGVVEPDGNSLGFRELLHPHVNERSRPGRVLAASWRRSGRSV